MYGYWRRPNNDPTVFGQALQEQTLYDPTTPAVTEAYVEEAAIGTQTAYADFQVYKRQKAMESGQKITAEEYKNNPELFSEGISWYDGMTVESAKIDKEFNDAARKRSQLIADASTGQDILGFAAGFAAGVFEPKNLAVGVGVSVAAPILGSAGWLGNSARRVYQMRKSASLANKIKIGVGEGVVAAAIVEPSNRYSAKQLQQDYTMADSAFNIFTSAAFGAGVPVIGNIISKAGPFMRSKIDKFGGNAMDIAATELDLAATQLASGQKVNVSAVEASQLSKISSKSLTKQFKIAQELGVIEKIPVNKEMPEILAIGEVKALHQEWNLKGLSPKRAADLTEPKSWVVREKDTGKAVVELTNKENVNKVNFEKYDVVPAAEHLANLNGRSFAKVPTGVEERARQAALGDRTMRDVVASIEEQNANSVKNAGTETLNPENDSLIDYAFINEEDQRRAALPQETDATRDAELANDEAEIRMMIEQEVLNEADLKEYNAALEALNDGKARKALETLKFCLLRG